MISPVAVMMHKDERATLSSADTISCTFPAWSSHFMGSSDCLKGSACKINDKINNLIYEKCTHYSKTQTFN